MYSCSENSFAKDVGFQTDDGGYWPDISAFKKSPDGMMHRISKAYFGPGDDFCSTWHFFDLLADGPAGWEPKYSY
ncbi:MAG: hypothetical protein KKG33_12085 [candidate division Zixibacteria bacterium]|nr:hypothetical protein [candidate division Zixibacteria bacterium]MBU1471643.1 hypothetical protein [candidate division Zixibacteria bacterium]MBU2626288.1 hypothetical protein [candidate division Zixibacteria bacterium]